MRITYVEAEFSKEEYENQKRYGEDFPQNFSGCAFVSCAGVNCNYCPLYGLTSKEKLEYIKNHLEKESEE